MKKLLLVLCLLVGVHSVSANTIPRSEYPRPQFDRSQQWLNLNGEWSYTIDNSRVGAECDFKSSKGFNDTIIVPFAPESKLSGVEHTDFITDMWYQRTIAIPSDWSSKDVMLNFGAVYYTCEVYIDGAFVGRHFGGSSSFAMNITPFVAAGKSHNLVVYVKNNLRDGFQTAGKQSLRRYSSGCLYTRTTGIWQTVWLEAVSNRGLKEAFVRSDVDNSRIVVEPTFYSESNGKLRITVKDGARVVARDIVSASNSSVAMLDIKKAKLWSPESPFLYDLLYEVLDAEGEVVDRVESYVGMRKVHIEGNKIYLNNQPYYQRLVLDQGFYPDGVWTAPSDEALRGDIELGLAAGFNGARLHQKVFEERYLYWADKLGYIVWGEAASWGMDVNSVEGARNFFSEWSEILVRDRNHPSIVTWTPQNEAWWADRVQYPRFISDLYNLTKAIDPTRPFHDCSGGLHIKTDIYSVHQYEQDPMKLIESLIGGEQMFEGPNFEPKGQNSRNLGFNTPLYNDIYTFLHYDGSMPYLLDEFGGIRWSPDLVDKSGQTWGYGDTPQSLEEFYTRLEGLVDALMANTDTIWGYCYTQLTDVELELNGIYYYNRDTKFDMDRIKAIFSKTPTPNINK